MKLELKMVGYTAKKLLWRQLLDFELQNSPKWLDGLFRGLKK